MPSIYINISMYHITTGNINLSVPPSIIPMCLEGMMLSMFIMITLMTLNMHFTLASMMPIILLVFAACETAVGLALLVSVSNTYGLDYAQNLYLP